MPSDKVIEQVHTIRELRKFSIENLDESFKTYHPIANIIKFGTEKELLLKLQNIDINDLRLPLNDNNDSALHIAADYQPSFISHLLKSGADQRLVNSDGYTALQILLGNEPINFAMCIEMINHEDNLYTKNSHGENVLDLAVREIFEILIKDNISYNKEHNTSEKLSDLANRRKQDMIRSAVVLFAELGDKHKIQKYLERKFDDIILANTRLESRIDKIAVYLEKMVQTVDCPNEQDLFSSTKDKMQKISIKAYLTHLANKLDPASSFNPISAVYFTAMLNNLELYLKKNNSVLTQYNIHNILLTSFLVTYKYLKEINPADTSYIAICGGVSVQKLIVMEREFLKMLHHSVQVNAQSIQNGIDRVNNNLELNFFAGRQNPCGSKLEIMSIDNDNAQANTLSRSR